MADENLDRKPDQTNSALCDWGRRSRYWEQSIKKKFAWNFQLRRAWIHYWQSFINNQPSNRIRSTSDDRRREVKHLAIMSFFLKPLWVIRGTLDVTPWPTYIQQARSPIRDPLHLDDLSRPPPQKVYVYNRERNTYTHSFLSHTQKDVHSRHLSTHIMWFPVWCVPLESPRWLLWASRWILQSVWWWWWRGGGASFYRAVIGSQDSLWPAHLTPSWLSPTGQTFQLSYRWVTNDLSQGKSWTDRLWGCVEALK